MQLRQSVLAISVTLISIILFFLSSVSRAELALDMTPGVTETSQEVYDLHRLMFYWCVAIGAVVFSIMFYSMFKHRKSVGHKAEQFHESVTVEVIWTVIPFIILIFMAVPATKTLVSMSDSSESDLTVLVTGSQWKWHYKYLDYEGNTDIDVSFYSNLTTPRETFSTPVSAAGLFPKNIDSYDGPRVIPEKSPNYLLEVDNPLVIPSGKKVRFLTTADDVIHSWWVPDFGFKKDAIPGFINESWTKVPPGKEDTYRGQCTELCGKDHGYMPVVVKVVNEDDFGQWLADSEEAQAQARLAAASDVNKTFDMDELMAVGEEVYVARCAACHQINGAGLPPTFPALKASAIAIEKDKIGEHISIVLNGKNAMPGFGSQLTPKEVAAVVTYERNAWGNNTGDIVQPKEVVDSK